MERELMKKNLHTFTALCNRNSIDPTRMARIVWGVLRPERKEMILKELLARGYHLPLPTPIKRVNGFALRG